MKTHANDAIGIALFLGMVPAVCGAGAVDAAMTRPIETRLARHVSIPYGTFTATSAESAFLKKAETAGLVTVAQGSGRSVVVSLSPKLVGVLVSDGTPAAWFADDGRRSDVSLRVYKAAVDMIVTDEEYKGRLAAPGEKHRLVLGAFKQTPTEMLSMVGSGLAPTEPRQRFRAIVKWSDFKKEWTVIALDVGTIDPEVWLSENVR